MIVFAKSLPIGNAVKLVIEPPEGAENWRVLRKTVNTFSGYDDPAATTVIAAPETDAIDCLGIVNGTPYYYAAFYTLDGAAWAASDSVSVTPATTYSFDGPDALEFVRARVEAGLKAAVASGTLAHAAGAIPVLTAPPLFGETRWPCVTVHVRSDAPGQRGLGEEVQADVFDGDEGDWEESEGWLSDIRLQVIAWSQNSDERINLRKVIKNIIIGNLPLFDSVGMVQVTFSQSDIEDFETYNTPVYQVLGEFSCLAPSVVQARAPAISDVTSTATAIVEG